MAVLGFLFFAAVLAASLWAIHATVAPRASYIVALLTGSTATAVLVPFTPRHPVRRIKPLPLRAELQMMRAAA